MMDEREAIVRWLREPARRNFIEMPERIETHGDHNLITGEWISWEETKTQRRLPTAHDYADAIERGDHLKEVSNGGDR